MNHGTTASLICPACGQAFLSMQHAMEGMTQCPHCAHTAPRAHFGTQAQVAGVAQVRRRVAQSPPPPATSAYPYAQPAPPSAQEWSGPAPAPAFQPALHAEAAPPPPAAAWQPPPMQPFPSAPAAASPPPSIARAALHPSPALMPVHAPPPPAEFTTASSQFQPSRSRRGIWLLAIAAVCGIGGWMWWDHAHTPLPPSRPNGASADMSAATEVRKALVPLPPPAPPVKLELQDTQAFAADAKQLVTDFFAATTPEGRAACVHDAARRSAEIEALFGPAAPKKIELRQLAHLPTVVLSLPGGQHMPLFKLVTSQAPAGALLRLESDADGKRRMFWPLLAETHEGRLAAFLQQPLETEPAWFYVALRPSHGLDLPAALRPKYLTFDVQITAASEPHLVACVERDTPLGRFMDRESDWGRVYLARLLVQRLDAGSSAPCMLVVDCEGATER